jgi:hypothetical protein
LTGKIKTHSTGIQKSFKEISCIGETVVIRLLNKAQHETNFKGEKKQIEQSKLEMFLCDRISNLNWEKAYSGHIRFRFDGMLAYLLDPNQKMPDEMRVSEEKAAIDLTELSEITIQPEELKVGGKSFAGGSKGQSEYEKLSDRVKFILDQMKLMFPNSKLDNINDLVVLMAEDGKEPGYVNHCYRLIIDVATFGGNTNKPPLPF